MSEPASIGVHCYADMFTLPENERWELIDGVLYNMTPAPSREHQEITMALLLALGNFLAGSPCRVFPAPFNVRLPKPHEDGLSSSTAVQPDISVVCDRRKLDKDGCVGNPDLVIEILSPTTRKKDLNQKHHTYEQSGVPEYWVVWPETQTVMVFLLNEQGRYNAPMVYERGDMPRSASSPAW